MNKYWIHYTLFRLQVATVMSHTNGFRFSVLTSMYLLRNGLGGISKYGLYFVTQRFLTAKIRRSIHFHKNLESLHDHIERAILPDSLGGSLDMNDAMDVLFKERLLKEDKCAQGQSSLNH